MSSELLGSRIFHRYHKSQRHRDKNHHHDDDEAFNLSPTRKTAYPLATKSTGIERKIPQASTEYMKDDLTLGYHTSPRHRYATERNPTEYEVSPASARTFRIVSLDDCYEEQVSPLLTDSSSSGSWYPIRGIPTIPAPPRHVMAKRDKNARRSKSNEGVESKRMEDSFMITSPPDVRRRRSSHNGNPFAPMPHDSEKKEEAIKITPPSEARRRRSSHSRSQFVFDGNLSFGNIAPSPMYGTTPNPVPNLAPNLSYSSPSRASFPGVMVMNHPPMGTPMSIPPMVPMTPLMTPMTPLPQMIVDGQEIEERTTPPPTPEEQRRRNRAMPSLQYENLVFNQWRQEQLQTRVEEQLRRQKTW